MSSSSSLSLPPLCVKKLSAVNTQTTHLSLARCQLKDEHLVLIDWSKLSSIRSLDLSNNLISSIPIRVFEQWSLLEELSLYKNQISEIPQGACIFLRKCHTLLLSDNCLRSLPPDFSKAASLRVLSLSSNRFSRIPACLSSCKALEQMDCDNNLLSASEAAVVGNIASLLPYLQSLPSSGLLGFGAILSDATTSNVCVRCNCREGEFQMLLHSELIAREPKFRNWDMSKVFGSEKWSRECIEAVFKFLYSGVVSAGKALLEELNALVAAEALESLTYVLEKAECASGDMVVLEDFASLGLHLERMVGEGSFEIESSDGIVLLAHESVLAARVSHFRRMINWKEGKEKRARVHFDSRIVRSLLTWCYTDKIFTEDEVDLADLLEAANFFCLDELALEIQAEIADALDESNCVFVMQLAEDLLYPTLKKLANTFADQHKIKVH